MEINNIFLIAVLITSFIVYVSFEDVFAEEQKTIQVEIKYTNGDIADHNEMKILVYQDFDKNPIIEKSLESNPELITVPENHRYKIEVFANGMYAGVNYVQSLTKSEELEIGIPPSVF